MDIPQARQAILEGRKDPFTLVGQKKGPSLYRPLMAPCLIEAYAEVEKRHDTRVVAVGVNTFVFAEMRKFGRNILDIEAEATLLRAGLMASLWGSMVLSFRQNELGDNEMVFVDEEGRTTKFEIAEGYPHEVEIEVRVRVDGGSTVQRTVVIPFAEAEHVDLLVQSRFPDVVAEALTAGVQARSSQEG